MNWTHEEAETALFVSLKDPEQADTPKRRKAVRDYEKVSGDNVEEYLKGVARVMKQVTNDNN